MIPKTIHYCWFGKKQLPREVKKCIESWKKYAPDYKIIEWNEKNFDVLENEFVKSAYNSKAWAFVSDYARLKVVYDNGGIYLDTDVELLRNPEFLLNNQFYIGVQQLGKYVTTGLGFGAEKHNNTVLRLMQQYENISFSEAEKEKGACPYLNMKVFEEDGYSYQNKIWRKGEIVIYPCEYFDPIAPASEDLLCDESVSIHHYSASWEKKGKVVERRIINFLGQKRINKMKKIMKFSRMVKWL